MSKLTQDWEKYLESRKPEDFDEIWKKTNGMVFFVAYNQTKDKKKSSQVVEDVFLYLETSKHKTKNFELWLTQLTKKMC